MRLQFLTLMVAIITAAVGVTTAVAKAPKPKGNCIERVTKATIVHRENAQHLRMLMGYNFYNVSNAKPKTCRYAQWIRSLWRGRSQRAAIQFANPPHKAAWLCIHKYEGAWNDSGSPYYGGLQMDIGFQQAYGLLLYREKGTADHWTPTEQMWVAENAYKTRGYWPWPNTAHYCNLI